MEEIHHLMISQATTVSVAESCTGGLLGSYFTHFPGSSNYFIGGMLTYSNNAKIHNLGVKKETIDDFGAVSQQTAIEMATRARILFNTDFGISVTGIAGPDGGSPEKPVGTVWIGIADKGQSFAQVFHFTGNRIENRDLSCFNALELFYSTYQSNEIRPFGTDFPYC